MNFDDLIIAKDKIPENLEEVYILNLQDSMKETFEKEDEFLSFITGFLAEYGHEIYEYNLKSFTKEEIWRNILLSKTEEHIKLMKFVVKFNDFLMPLFEKYSYSRCLDSFVKEAEELEKDAEKNDEWTTE